MTQTQEFSGKDVDVAIKNACSQLMLSRDELKYDVISEGASGIFGIVGRRDAKIRVVISDSKADTTKEAEMEGIRSIVDEAFGEETRLEEFPKKAAPKKETSKSQFNKKETYKKGITKKEIDGEESTKEGITKSEIKKDASKKESDNKQALTPDHKPEPVKTPEPVDVSEMSIALGIEALQKMADLITDEATISAQTESDRLTLKIEGGNAGILIGRKGQTLDAMQFLADKIINRKSDARVRVKVDIEGYMETRKSNLQHLANKMADKAKKTGRPATINQMSAQDRRIVHLALKDDESVRTQSMGDGYYRRLVIFPKKKNSLRGKRRLKK